MQDSCSVILLGFSSNPFVEFYLRLSGDLEAVASSIAGVGVALSES